MGQGDIGSYPQTNELRWWGRTEAPQSFRLLCCRLKRRQLGVNKAEGNVLQLPLRRANRRSPGFTSSKVYIFLRLTESPLSLLRLLYLRVSFPCPSLKVLLCQRPQVSILVTLPPALQRCSDSPLRLALRTGLATFCQRFLKVSDEPTSHRHLPGLWWTLETEGKAVLVGRDPRSLPGGEVWR